MIFHKGLPHKILSDQFLQVMTEIKPLPGINESKCFMCKSSFGTTKEYKAHTERVEHKFRVQYRMGRYVNYDINDRIVPYHSLNHWQGMSLGNDQCSICPGKLEELFRCYCQNHENIPTNCHLLCRIISYFRQ